MIIHEDGEISAWEWQPESWKWASKGFGQLRLPPRVFEARTPRVISHPLVAPSKRIYWIEAIIEDEAAQGALRSDPRSHSHALFCLDYRYIDSPSLRPQEAKSAPPMQLDLASSNLLGLWSTPIQGLWRAPRDGLWLQFAPSSRRPSLHLAFFSMMTKKSTSFDKLSEHQSFVHHQTSLEMTTLSAQGLLSVLRPTSESALAYEPLSQLSPFYSPSTTMLHQHLITLLDAGSLRTYEVRSGLLLHTLSLPSSRPVTPWVPLSTRDTSCGIWTPQGVWRVRSLPISQYAHVLATSTTTAPMSASSTPPLDALALPSADENRVRQPITGQLSAALLTHDWSLGRLEAQHLLDILIAYTGIAYPSVQDTVTFITACDKLVPHLQSPIVLISILEQARLSSFACTITKHFIDACLARHSSGMSTTIVSQNEVDARAFRLFTTFNTDTIHLLRKFVELASPDAQNTPLSQILDAPASSDEDSRVRAQVTALTVADCAKLDLNQFHIFMNRCPDALLLKLEEYSGLPVGVLASEAQRLLDMELDSGLAFIRASFSKYCHPDPNAPTMASVNTILLREEERATHPDTLDTLCYLLYIYKPHWVLPLVDMLLSREGFSEGRSLLPRRAAAALPLLDDQRIGPSGESNKDSQRTEDLRLVARVGLLQRAQRPGSVLKLLLHLYTTTREERYWDLVLSFIDLQGSSSQAQKTQTEVLTSLLMQCLEPTNRLASPRHVEAVWQRLPTNLAPLDLVTSLRQEIARIQTQPRVPVLVADESSQVSVDLLRKQLFKIGVK